MGYCVICKEGFEGRHNCVKERNPNTLLANHLHVRMQEAGINPDVYDTDFIMGVITDWLDQHDAVISAQGVRKR